VGAALVLVLHSDLVTAVKARRERRERKVLVQPRLNWPVLPVLVVRVWVGLLSGRKH
jgi:hypothetical protein